VDYPRALWLPILYGIILNVRPAPAARNYRKIWREDSNESPLRYYTRRQAEELARVLGAGVVLDWAMRYGAPSIAARLEVLREAGCARILIVPLYPQYSATTSASVADAVFDALNPMRAQPAIRIASAFYAAPDYIGALGAVARGWLKGNDWTPERIVLSFHGLPQRYVDAGDPYYRHCAETARLLREKMGWAEDYAPMAFQSKFGRETWLEPATEDMIKTFAAEGVKRIAVMAPAFISDCVESLEEIAISAREIFLAAGGEDLRLIPCLNDSAEAIALLASLIRREIAGWA
jgi:ferrochelatase